MILVDMNQVTISNLMMQIGSKRKNDVDENLVRHMVLNSLRMYRSRFSEEYGELVLCYDSKKYWRRDYFPNYKSNRKKDREASGLDWNLIFETPISLTRKSITFLTSSDPASHSIPA